MTSPVNNDRLNELYQTIIQSESMKGRPEFGLDVFLEFVGTVDLQTQQNIYDFNNLDAGMRATISQRLADSALVLSDNHEKGLVKDLSTYELWCRLIAEDIAGKKIEQMKELVFMDDMPVVLKMALNAVLNGVSLIRS